MFVLIYRAVEVNAAVNSCKIKPLAKLSTACLPIAPSDKTHYRSPCREYESQPILITGRWMKSVSGRSSHRLASAETSHAAWLRRIVTGPHSSFQWNSTRHRKPIMRWLIEQKIPLSRITALNAAQMEISQHTLVKGNSWALKGRKEGELRQWSRVYRWLDLFNAKLSPKRSTGRDRNPKRSGREEASAEDPLSQPKRVCVKGDHNWGRGTKLFFFLFFFCFVTFCYFQGPVVAFVFVCLFVFVFHED